jgi:hypothetical protein
MMKTALNGSIKIYAALLTAAIVLAASGCAGESMAPSAATSLSATPSAAEVSAGIEMYRPELFRDGDTSEFHYSFLQSSCLVIPIEFPCKDCEIELKVSAGVIAAAREGAASAYDSDRFKELRYTPGQVYAFIGWYPIEDGEGYTFADRAIITFTIYEGGEPKAHGEIDAVKTTGQPMYDINYELTLVSLELCP